MQTILGLLVLVALVALAISGSALVVAGVIAGIEHWLDLVRWLIGHFGT